MSGYGLELLLMAGPHWVDEIPLSVMGAV
jgi:hypothetical protein